MDKEKIITFLTCLLLVPNLCSACFVIGFVLENNPSLFAIIVFVGVWLIEAIGARKKIGREPQKLFLAVFVANIVTTLLGVLVSLTTDIDFITAFITSFFFTILIEAVVLRFFFNEESWSNLLSISFTVNAESYLFLFLLMVTETVFLVGGMVAILIIIPSFLFQSFNFLSAGKNISKEKKRFYKIILVILSVALITLSFRGAIKGSTLFGGLSGRSTSRSRARDAVRQSDMRQLFTAQKMYYEQNGIYFTAPDREGTPEIPELLPALDDLNSPSRHYIWLNNINDNQKFCVYVELEYEESYFAASHKGTKELTSIPTSTDCWW